MFTVAHKFFMNQLSGTGAAIRLSGTIAAGGSTVSLTDSNLAGNTITGALVMVCATSYTEPATMGIGFWDGTNQVCYGMCVEYGTPPDLQSQRSNTGIPLWSSLGNADSRLIISSTTNGITLTLESGVLDTSNGMTVYAILFTDDVEVHVGSLNCSTSADGTATYSSCPFEPKVGIVCGSQTATLNSTDTNKCKWGFGFADWTNSGDTQQAHTLVCCDDASYALYDLFTTNPSSTYVSSSKWEAATQHITNYEITTFASNGFTVTTRSVSGTPQTEQLYFMILGGKGIKRAAIKTSQAGTTTSSSNFTDVTLGYVPHLVLANFNSRTTEDSWAESEHGNNLFSAYVDNGAWKALNSTYSYGFGNVFIFEGESTPNIYQTHAATAGIALPDNPTDYSGVSYNLYGIRAPGSSYAHSTPGEGFKYEVYLYSDSYTPSWGSGRINFLCIEFANFDRSIA